MGWLRLMNKINSFLKLSSSRKDLFIKSLVIIIFIRLCFFLFPYSQVKRISKRFSKPNNIRHKPTTEDILWSIRVASLHIPGSTCLIQATTAQILLSRYHYPSKLKIGVMKTDKFKAHAWIEINDKIVLGESDQKYVPIFDSDN